MRVAVIGSKSLSVGILQTLVGHGHDVLVVYSRDSESGMNIWREKLGHPSLSEKAKQLGIPAYESMKVNSKESLSLLESLDLDVIFSCFWSEIFKEPILNIPRYGVFNFHTALLPKNRGSRPIPWALINDEKQAGITLHKMMTGVDNGPIVDQRAITIEFDDTSRTIYNKLITEGIEMFKESLPSFETRSFKLTHQDAEQASYQPRGEPYGGQLNPYWDDEKQRLFKAAFTFPPFRAWRFFPNTATKRVKICISRLTEKNEIKYSNDQFLSQCIQNSIGSKHLRNEIRDTISEERFILLDNKLNAESMFPLHDIFLSNRAGVSLKTLNSLNQNSIQDTQPHRYKNGLLEIPHYKCNSEKELAAILDQASLQLERAFSDLFIHLLILDSKVSDKAISQEIERIGGEKVTFDQVCELFDTDYEEISS